MSRFLQIFILLTAVQLGFTSCGDEPDGKWEKMKWTNVDNLMNIQGSYIIPEEGGTFRFQCWNYSVVWVDSYSINGVSYTLGGDDIPNVNDLWFGLNITDNKMTITADPLPESVESRYFSLDLTAGDTFDTLVFKQQRGVY